MPLPLFRPTPRLTLRWFEPEDAESLFEAISSDREALLPWLPWAAWGHRTADETRFVIDRFAQMRSFVEPDEFAVGVFDRETGDIVGGTGFHRIRPEIGDAEVGYWLRRNRRGRGYCTEAVASLITSAFRDWGFRRLRITCDEENLASRGVPERLGIRLECMERRRDWLEGLGWRDKRTYGVLAEEWDADLQRVRGPAPATSTPRAGTSKKGFGAVDPRIAPYLERLLEPEDAVLLEIRDRSAREGLPPIAVGPFDGRHLEVLARALAARKVVEIGTLGGYSGVCLARALPADGVLHTFEIDPHHAEVARESFRRAGVAERIRVHVGPALERLPEIEASGPFDLAFIDADKAGYPDYLAWCERHVRVGGTVLADNVFRRAAFPVPDDPPSAAEGIRRFNESLARSGRFRTTMLPLEDGLAFGVRVA